jgi:hypothetical protein
MTGSRLVSALGAGLGHDLRSVVRGRDRLIPLLAALSLALGIGATTAVFSLASALLIARLPVAAPIFARSSSNLVQWSEPTVVAGGGSSGTGRLSAECPQVVARSGA